MQRYVCGVVHGFPALELGLELAGGDGPKPRVNLRHAELEPPQVHLPGVFVDVLWGYRWNKKRRRHSQICSQKVTCDLEPPQVPLPSVRSKL